VTLDYGVFTNTVLDFIIIAFAILLVVKAMNAARKKEEAARVGRCGTPARV
jgi:large conductance mechanosensitive channel